MLPRKGAHVAHGVCRKRAETRGGKTAAMVWVRSQWQNVVRGFWFFPGVVALGGVGLALALLEVDRAAGPDGLAGALAFDGDASAARTILGTIAGSLITVAGLAFSITVVTLQLVAGQFTPRAVRSFLGDRPSQLVAGAFVGIFAYCLLVLRAVRDEDDDFEGFVPALSVTVSIALGLLGLVLLLVFIHRITQLVKVENIAARIARETTQAIDELYPEPHGDRALPEADEGPDSWARTAEPWVVRPERPGYVRSIALAELTGVGLPPGARVHVAVRPGDAVTRATALMEAWPRAAAEEAAERLRGLVSVQSERDVSQDTGFGIRQLADLAVRALSPGINDPTTAVTSIAYLRDALELLAVRRFPDRLRRLEGDLVVHAEAHGFESLLREAFAEIGLYARSNARVVLAVLDALAGVASAAEEAGAGRRATAATALAEEVGRPAVAEARTERDRALLEAALARAGAAGGR